MASIKPSVPKGTRDFSPTEMVRRNYIFDTIKSVFRKYGYQQIETPTMENLSTLTGKYGDEGDKLIFKVLESGDYLSKIKQEFDTIETVINQAISRAHAAANVPGGENESYFFIGLANKYQKIREEWLSGKLTADQALFGIDQRHLKSKFTPIEIGLNSISLSSFISEKALRYDLTVPFARYVVQHQNEITFPFKRFQVQPVWRADRPQKGRYREFYQCDADVVGSDSLLNEAEFVLIYDEALSALGLKDFTIKINNRKILSGIAEIIDKADNIVDLTVAIDKLDKIGLDGVTKQLMERGFSADDIEKIKPVILLEGNNEQKLESLRLALINSDTGLKGCDEIETVLSYIASCQLTTANLELDITLARGLNYYTGAIFEVKTNEVAMGSIGGGGRYDDLTGMFGLKGLTGVGISFGADRIYDVMEELNLFPAETSQTTQLLICCFDQEGEKFGFPIIQELRKQGVSAELYPAGAKLKKQLDYANGKNIPYVIIIGSEEIESGLLTLKNMETGVQEKRTVEQIIAAKGKL
ncbi:histidine--tRNA ligase [uncultured Mucilaginibacter sp.]|uniref:histidine--tRNA ligase n=1 Tax=uncultured Mucilaginibacter sp. TaxID=797541 RepID=UPI0025E12CE2|nr:histidine--tRNA ligase [uncultured Mucilaginibacter sp.]